MCGSAGFTTATVVGTSEEAGAFKEDEAPPFANSSTLADAEEARLARVVEGLGAEIKSSGACPGSAAAACVGVSRGEALAANTAGSDRVTRTTAEKNDSPSATEEDTGEEEEDDVSGDDVVVVVVVVAVVVVVVVAVVAGDGMAFP